MTNKTDKELEKKFEIIFFHLEKGVTKKQYLAGLRYEIFSQVKEWKNNYGYKLNIYKDHLINNKEHFHFDKKSDNISLKIDFDGNILENLNNSLIPNKIKDSIEIFCRNNKNLLINKWNIMNQ